MIIACVLRESPEFGPRELNLMVESVLDYNPDADIHCLTDSKSTNINSRITTHPLQQSEWTGWWSKIELFNTFRGPTLYLDIDTVVVGKLPDIGPKFTMLSDVYQKDKFGSGVMSWHDSPISLYNTFSNNPEKYMKYYTKRSRWGDQAFISDHLGFRPDVFGEEYRSYKVHCKDGIPNGTKVVYFHGKPRPWEIILDIAVPI